MKFFASPNYTAAIVVNLSFLLVAMHGLLGALTDSRTLSNAIRNDAPTKYYDDDKLVDITAQYKAYKAGFNISFSLGLIFLFNFAYLMKKNWDALSTQLPKEERFTLNTSMRQNESPQCHNQIKPR